jgi:hypothetical protein
MFLGLGRGLPCRDLRAGRKLTVTVPPEAFARDADRLGVQYPSDCTSGATNTQFVDCASGVITSRQLIQSDAHHGESPSIAETCYTVTTIFPICSLDSM